MPVHVPEYGGGRVRSAGVLGEVSRDEVGSRNHVVTEEQQVRRRGRGRARVACSAGATVLDLDDADAGELWRLLVSAIHDDDDTEARDGLTLERGQRPPQDRPAIAGGYHHREVSGARHERPPCGTMSAWMTPQACRRPRSRPTSTTTTTTGRC